MCKVKFWSSHKERGKELKAPQVSCNFMETKMDDLNIKARLHIKNINKESLHLSIIQIKNDTSSLKFP